MVTMVNSRVVKNKVSVDSINNAYRRYLADKRYPIAIVNIEIDPYLVDVRDNFQQITISIGLINCSAIMN